jgi:hypothetical protein
VKIKKLDGRYLRNASEGGGGGGTGEPDGGTGGVDDGGEPKGKPNTFTPITSQEDFDKAISRRINSERAKFADYDSIKAKADQYDILANESKTDREREIEEARLEAFHEAMSKAVPVAVRAEFKSAAKGLLTNEALQSLLEDLDLTKYATDDGDPDEEKIAKKVAALAPAQGSGGRRGTTGFGQGTRQSSQLRKGEAGLLEAQRRFGQQQTANTSS